MRLLTWGVLIGILLGPAGAHAQIVLRRSPSTATADPARPVPAAEPGRTGDAQAQTRAAQDEGSPLLTQAALNVGEEMTVSVQAFEYFVSNRTRFYLRSTLPLTSEAPASPRTDPSEALRTGLLDPFGGLLNTTVGFVYPNVPGPFSLDARTGLKLLEVPAPAEEGSEDGETQYEPKPFFTGMMLAKAALNLKRAADDADEDAEGTLLLAAGLNVTAAGSEEYLTSLTGVDRVMANVTLHAAINLPGIFYITLEGAPWSSNDAIGKRFVVSINAMRK